MVILRSKFVSGLAQRLQSSSIASRIVKGSFWNTASSVGSKALGVVGSMAIARLLGTLAFGKLGIIQSTLDMFVTIASAGMGLTASKFVAENRATNPLRAGRVVALSSCLAWSFGIVVGLVLFVLAGPLALRALGAADLAQLLRLSAICLLFTSVNGAQLGVLSGLEAFRQIAAINVISAVLVIIGRIVGAYYFGLTGAVAAMVGSQGLTCICSYLFLQHLLRKNGIVPTRAGILNELWVVWRFAVPTVLSSLTSLPVIWICNAMLVKQPNGFVEMGMFSAANQWYFLILFFPQIIAQTAMPILSNHIGLGRQAESTRTILFLTKLNSLVLIPILVLVLCSKPIMALYGHDFPAGWITMSISIATAGIVALQTPTVYLFAASGKMWLWLYMSAGHGIAFIGFNALLVHNGAAGLATARLLASCLHAGWSFWYLLSQIKAEERPVYVAP